MINKILKLSFLCLLTLGLHHTAAAQVQNVPPMRQVLGTAGGSGTFPWGTIDYTVGEVMVTSDSTASPFSSVKWLTQGFQQPEDNAFSVEAVGVNSTCIGASNGSANLSVINNSGTVTYSWQNSAFGPEFLFEDLAPGTYSYVVKDGNFSIPGTVTITEDQVDCGAQLVIYKGITPNQDGHNDNWQIDGITNFKTNIVSIYNRWGDLVWTKKNYDNEAVVWDGKNTKDSNLPDATYFYIIEAGGKVYKGWVELTH